MLLYTRLLAWHGELCHARGIRYAERALHDVQIRIFAARRLAEEMAAGREEDEPAALLWALLLESEALGDLRDAFPVLAVRRLLGDRGLVIAIDFNDRVALQRIRERALAEGGPSRPSYAEVRAFLAARIRPREG
jgi:hypothetical protein